MTMAASMPTRRQALLGLAALAGCRPGPAPERGAPPDGAPSPSSVSGTATADPATPRAPIERGRARIDALKAVRERLRPLHQRLGPARPGEWRAEHPEAGETFEQYLSDRPITPDGERRVLAIHPLGQLTPIQRKIVGLTADYMGRYFDLETRIEPELPESAVPDRARRTHPTWGGKQILTRYVLDDVLRPRLPRDAVASIAFTATDLWPGGGWNFVFGEADLHARVGVWSMQRFGDPAASAAAYTLALIRTIRVAIHETGHMLSLRHCTAYRCVQGGVNSLEEDDRAPLWLCPECVSKILWATGADARARYGKLAAFCKEHRLATEAAFFDRSIAALGPA